MMLHSLAENRTHNFFIIEIKMDTPSQDAKKNLPNKGKNLTFKNGCLVALITPMYDDGSLDLDSYRQLIDWHISAGTAALVVVGTTGESPTVSFEEHELLIRIAVSQTKGRIPVIAGAGANSTREAVELTTFAKQAGADATLQVTPYYNRPTQEGLLLHYQKIAESVDLPLILYDVPARTGVSLSNEVVLKLSQVPGIIGIKDATGNIVRAIELITNVSDDFSIYSGNDDSAFPLMQLGAKGVISVAANIVPELMVELCSYAVNSEKSNHAKTLNNKLFPLFQALAKEVNPIPVKWALNAMKRIHAGIRLPLTKLSSPQHAQLIHTVLENLGILK